MIEWTKSSFSFANGNCVQSGVWRKASYSGNNGGGCVEVTATREAVAPHKSGQDVLYLVRDSKDAGGPVLAFTTAEWDAFIQGVKNGEFDLAPAA